MQNNANNHNNVAFPCSRAFYCHFKTLYLGNVCNVFLSQYASADVNIDYVYRRKVMAERETKLKEFNYKLIYGILPCNKNLEKWKIISNNKCDVCNGIQTIEHLLFQCHYAQKLCR